MSLVQFKANMTLSFQLLLTLYLQVLSADNFCKQFGPRSGPNKAQQNVRSDLDPNCLTLMVFLKEFFKKVDFEKDKQKTKSMQNFAGGKEL